MPLLSDSQRDVSDRVALILTPALKTRATSRLVTLLSSLARMSDRRKEMTGVPLALLHEWVNVRKGRTRLEGGCGV